MNRLLSLAQVEQQWTYQSRRNTAAAGPKDRGIQNQDTRSYTYSDRPSETG